MVGVAGRSKACKTCKQRKIACSLEEPECKICIKSKRICGGYSRDRVFILDHRTKFSVEKSPKETIASSEEQSVAKSKTVKYPHKKTIVPAKQPRIVESTVSTNSAYDAIWIFTTPSTRAVYREKILEEFLYIAILDPTNSIGDMQGDTEHNAGNWLRMLPSIPGFTVALEASILAVCVAKLGRANNDSNLVRESLKFYVQGLYQLQIALWTPSLMHREETVAACMALVLYEGLECPGMSTEGRKHHVKGCSKLIRSRGPKSYSSDFAHQLFLSFRHIEIQQAITERRATFLAEADWLEFPFEAFDKPLSGELLDLVASITTIVERGYRLLGPANDNSRLVDPTTAILASRKLFDNTWMLDSQLHDFFLRFKDSSTGPLYWEHTPKNGLCGIILPEFESVFPIRFQFPDLQTAHTCMLYWATVSIVWAGMKFVHRVLPWLEIRQTENRDHAPFLIFEYLMTLPSDFRSKPPSTQHCYPSLNNRYDVTAPARNICQSMDFCMQKSMAGVGYTALFFPLKVAIETFSDAPGCERELAWAEEMMERIAKGGLRILDHLGTPMVKHYFMPG
ncbi:hypothetical protein BJ875DRAFT_287963 [Amylocarpus encephaloides]|uniref:Zn(2)-C6 fungal-type domain-containing protein n=1 Tax=Amylocarpus encephaloides TaxID=45428 RepID=A0A9P7YK29_9HELO|nr:hypothetical protein BJ875DRAFT_287963 [Amylocarpus encephaloides]